ncbi:MAG: metallophosphoesterase [Firmicutes bacterium]|nr:metallophosphoesterase [Bacillota bacterium]
MQQKIYAISDLHLSLTVNKPMDIFGSNWDNYWQRITDDWNKTVKDNDVVLIPGDISWAMYLEEAQADLKEIGKLAGKKVILRGNHDYWWKSITAVRNILPDGMFALQNDCVRFGNVLIAGSRGWSVPEYAHKKPADEVIFKREVIRLELSLKSMQEQRQEGDYVIVMMHYPPFNAKRSPSEFTGLIEEYKVDAVIYGHLHGCDVRSELYLERNGVKYYLTSCDLVNHKLTLIH